MIARPYELRYRMDVRVLGLFFVGYVFALLDLLIIPCSSLHSLPYLFTSLSYHTEQQHHHHPIYLVFDLVGKISIQQHSGYLTG